VMRTFHHELYQLDRLDSVNKVGILGWSEVLNSEAKAASVSFFDRIFADRLGVRDILTSTRGFLGPRLAPLYGQSAPAALEERELGPQRRGYFMQIPPLMLGGASLDPASLQRGASMASNVLCLDLPPDPGGLVRPLPAFEPGQTNRERVTAMFAGCGGTCHEAINSLGFAFEGFDTLGVARDQDRGQPIDASGRFLFSSGDDSFADAAELMTKLADDDLPHACYGRKLASYGLQRDMVEDDQELIDSLAAASRLGAVKDVVLALIGEPTFRLRQKDLP
jgi:hypothetical protein